MEGRFLKRPRATAAAVARAPEAPPNRAPADLPLLPLTPLLIPFVPCSAPAGGARGRHRGSECFPAGAGLSVEQRGRSHKGAPLYDLCPALPCPVCLLLLQAACLRRRCALSDASVAVSPPCRCRLLAPPTPAAGLARRRPAAELHGGRPRVLHFRGRRGAARARQVRAPAAAGQACAPRTACLIDAGPAGPPSCSRAPSFLMPTPCAQLPCLPSPSQLHRVCGAAGAAPVCAPEARGGWGAAPARRL